MHNNMASRHNLNAFENTGLTLVSRCTTGRCFSTGAMKSHGVFSSRSVPAQPIRASAYMSASVADVEQAQSTLPEAWTPQDLEDDNLHEDLQQRIRPPKERLVHKLRLSKLRSRRYEVLRAARRSMALRQDNDRLLDIVPGKFLTREQQERLCGIWQEWRRIEDAKLRMPARSYASKVEYQAVWAGEAGITTAELGRMQVEGPHAAVLLLASVERLLRKEAQQCTIQGMDIEDVISEARGLWLDAAARCDSSRANLISFGVMYLRQRLSRIIDREGSLLDRPPASLYDSMALRKCMGVLRDRLGRKPTTAELATESNFSKIKVGNLLKNHKYASSIDAPAPGAPSDDEQTVGETIPDAETEASDATFDLIIKREMEAEVHAVLESCVKDPSMRNVLLRYYGFYGDKEVVTLKSLGEELGVSGEAVRLRMARAKKAIQKHPWAMERLMTYRDERLRGGQREVGRAGTPTRA